MKTKILFFSLFFVCATLSSYAQQIVNKAVSQEDISAIQEILKSAPASSYKLDLGSSKKLKLSSVKASGARIGGAKGGNVASIIIIHRDGNKPGNLSKEQLSRLSAIASKYQ